MNAATCGYKRGQVKFRIREALEARGLTMSRLAVMVGVSPQAVQKTVSGTMHSPKILEALRNAGVPEKFLFDPKKILSAD